jgi:predicted nicotinamide N-methyase
MAAELVEEVVRVGEVELSLLRPADPETLLDEEAFARDEFIPYWAELWPSGVALARALPPSLADTRVVELGCGLGVPSLVAAARGADVLTVDWADDAIALLRRNAARNRIELRAERADWRTLIVDRPFDLALAADVLYERRNVEPLLQLLPRIAPEVLLAEPGRPYFESFLAAARTEWTVDELDARVYRLRRDATGIGSRGT